MKPYGKLPLVTKGYAPNDENTINAIYCVYPLASGLHTVLNLFSLYLDILIYSHARVENNPLKGHTPIVLCCVTVKSLSNRALCSLLHPIVHYWTIQESGRTLNCITRRNKDQHPRRIAIPNRAFATPHLFQCLKS